jgi:hypothetical protein
VQFLAANPVELAAMGKSFRAQPRVRYPRFRAEPTTHKSRRYCPRSGTQCGASVAFPAPDSEVLNGGIPQLFAEKI